MNIENLAQSLIEQAIYFEATDIHLIPNIKNYRIEFRIHGFVVPHITISREIGERLTSHLKFMASMEIGEKRKPQSGAFSFQCIPDVSLRISTLPTALGYESVAIRILHQQLTLSTKHLSLFPSATNQLFSLLHYNQGMLLLTGPTGSGKSTTLLSLAEYCAKHLHKRVITLEDPVEKRIDSVLQVQVNEKAGLSFHTGLKAVLRHDPDVIVIGEIRDGETALIGIRAALTGHLVLATLHSRNAIGALYRLVEYGIKDYELEQTIIAVTNQRLVHLNCPFCGSVCSKYCKSNHRVKRTGVFEILHGEALEYAIQHLQQGIKSIPNFNSLERVLSKGGALGFISYDEFFKWSVDKENESKRTSSVFYSYR